MSDHVISGLSSSQGGNNGKVTVQVSGFNFDPQTKATIKDAFGNTIATGVVYFKDTGSLSVTFDLTGKPAGSYRIELENQDGSSTSEEFDIVEGKEGELFSRLIFKI